MFFNMGGGGSSENLTEQLNQMDALLTEVEESLVGKASGANITPETVLKGYKGYKNKELIVGEYEPHGKYLWKKSASQGGEIVDYMVSENKDEYPDGGMYNGYWFERVIPATNGIIERNVDAEGYPIDVLFKIDHVVTMGTTTATNHFGPHFKRAEKIEIVCDTLLPEHFSGIGGASNDNKRIKIKCKTINNEALKNAFNRTGGDAKLWISDICETIDKASSWGVAPFTYSPATEMYCESETKKSGWGSMWNYKYNGSTMTTYYGITEEAFDAL